jgi:hypothetical protein
LYQRRAADFEKDICQMSIPAEVHQSTIPAGNVAQPRPDRINADRSPGGEVARDAYKSNLSKPAPNA